MLTRSKILQKYQNTKDNPLRIIVFAIKLPTGAIETIVDYEKLESKLDYVLNAYDDDLKLKTNPDIRILDCIIL